MLPAALTAQADGEEHGFQHTFYLNILLHI